MDAGYEGLEEVPQLFVLMGNFTSPATPAASNAVTIRENFNALAATLRAFPRIRVCSIAASFTSNRICKMQSWGGVSGSHHHLSTPQRYVFPFQHMWCMHRLQAWVYRMHGPRLNSFPPEGQGGCHTELHLHRRAANSCLCRAHWTLGQRRSCRGRRCLHTLLRSSRRRCPLPCLPPTLAGCAPTTIVAAAALRLPDSLCLPAVRECLCNAVC